jgi:hypothetical protein
MLDRYAFPSLRYHLLRLFDAKDQAERLMNDLLNFPVSATRPSASVSMGA